MILISVIIPTRNRASLLKKTLSSIAEVEFEKDSFEVIVVDNASTDETRDICASSAHLFSHFRYEYAECPGLHLGRHRGMNVAKGSILTYADDDIRSFPSWLTAILQAFDHGVVLVGGKVLPDFECSPPSWFSVLWSETPWGLVNGHHSLVDFGDQIKEIPPEYVFGCNFSIRKDALQGIGGFHPDGMPKELLRFRGDGETSVSLAIAQSGLKAVYHPEASVYHWVSRDRMAMDYLYRRNYAQGISDSFSRIRHIGRVQEEQTRLQIAAALAREAKLRLVWLHKYGPIRMLQMDRTRRIIYKGWTDGFTFHQREVRSSKTLLQWVKLENYLNEYPSACYYRFVDRSGYQVH